MKKAISMILALVLVLSMSITAFAAEVPDGGTQSITATYSEVESTIVYKVDISWGGMVFNYNSGMENVWNPDTLKFETVQKDEASWAPAAQGGDTVTVINHSNAGVDIDITYTKAENGVDGTLENGSFTLGSADNGTDGAAGTATSNSAKLTLSTANIPDSFKDGSSNVVLGSLTVSISYATAIDATNMTADELKVAVAARLAAGETNITVALAEDAEQEMFSAIWTAFSESTAADGSIELTISGAKTVPEEGFFDIDNYSENGEKNIAGDKLKSLTLTDVETIGERAFAYSSLLTSVNLPKVVTIGIAAFVDCDLRTLILPEVTTIGGEAFMNNDNLVSCVAAKATTIGAYPWGNCSKLETLTLAAAGDFTLDDNLFKDTPTGQINLALDRDKVSQVTWNDDGTATWATTNQNGGSLTYTFKSITLI